MTATKPASGRIQQRLAEKGIKLPPAASPVGAYLPWVLSGALLVISGQLPYGDNGAIAAAHSGKLGESVSEADGAQAARVCALNLLAQAQAALGDLDRIARCVRLGGFINCTPDFIALASVLNGASDVMVDCLGEAGRHARYAVGAAQLPLNVAVEVEAMFEIRP